MMRAENSHGLEWEVEAYKFKIPEVENIVTVSP
jgi:hypothetical protein